MRIHLSDGPCCGHRAEQVGHAQALKAAHAEQLVVTALAGGAAAGRVGQRSLTAGRPGSVLKLGSTLGSGFGGGTGFSGFAL